MGIAIAKMFDLTRKMEEKTILDPDRKTTIKHTVYRLYGYILMAAIMDIYVISAQDDRIIIWDYDTGEGRIVEKDPFEIWWSKTRITNGIVLVFLGSLALMLILQEVKIRIPKYACAFLMIWTFYITTSRITNKFLGIYDFADKNIIGLLLSMPSIICMMYLLMEECNENYTRSNDNHDLPTMALCIGILNITNLAIQSGEIQGLLLRTIAGAFVIFFLESVEYATFKRYDQYWIWIETSYLFFCDYRITFIALSLQIFFISYMDLFPKFDKLPIYRGEEEDDTEDTAGRSSRTDKTACQRKSLRQSIHVQEPQKPKKKPSGKRENQRKDPLFLSISTNLQGMLENRRSQTSKEN